MEKAYRRLVEQDAPVSTEDLERFSEMLRRYESQDYRSAASASLLLSKNIERASAVLPSLRIGPSPEYFEGRIKDCWDALAEAWATRATLEEFNRKLAEILYHLENERESLTKEQRTLDDQQTRLETLRKVADLLDDLLPPDQLIGDDCV